MMLRAVTVQDHSHRDERGGILKCAVSPNMSRALPHIFQLLAEYIPSMLDGNGSLAEATAKETFDIPESLL